jgi:hypothetical protein
VRMDSLRLSCRCVQHELRRFCHNQCLSTPRVLPSMRRMIQPVRPLIRLRRGDLLRNLLVPRQISPRFQRSSIYKYRHLLCVHRRRNAATVSTCGSLASGRWTWSIFEGLAVDAGGINQPRVDVLLEDPGGTSSRRRCFKDAKRKLPIHPRL